MSGKKKKGTGHKLAVQNRKARHNYFIEGTIEAGLVLVGTEVKSLREGHGSLNESYAAEKNGELYLFNAYIPEYTKAGAKFQHEVRRPRKLLVHKKERDKLLGASQGKGMTLAVLSIYFKRGLAKAEIGIARGKKEYDKRQTIKDRSWQRDQARIMREKG